MTASVISYDAPLQALVSVRGHPFERDPFEAVFESIDGIATTFVDQPAAAGLMCIEGLKRYQALVLYDMPGIDFAHVDAPGYIEPADALKTGLRAALNRGKGVVALHHAIAGWPAWPEYGDLIGGRFLYRHGTVREQHWPDSGYRHDVTHTISIEPGIEDVFAPLFEGVPQRFTLTDELYLAPIFEEDLIPLLRSDHVFERDGFYSATLAVGGQMFSNEGWTHPPGSNLVGWVKRAGKSPLVYLQLGDGPETYADPNFRRLVENAIRWVASDAALDWARSD